MQASIRLEQYLKEIPIVEADENFNAEEASLTEEEVVALGYALFMLTSAQ